MKNKGIVIKSYLFDKLGIQRRKTAKESNIYIGKPIMSCYQGQKTIYNTILSDVPCFIGRLGGNELFSMSVFEFDIVKKQEKAINQLCTCGGFFCEDISEGIRFNEYMKHACAQVDVLGVFGSRFEDYYIRRYMPHDVQFLRLEDLEPWKFPDHPWTMALKGKKVLVIHPLAETIEKQYQRREEIFVNTNILPEFELKTLKSVQTIAGEKDTRFENWFDALQWMYDEAIKIDFDVAIIGCGAYGFPLAAMLKKAGKQAVHLGGATQVLFGIKGKRWDQEDHIKKYYNSSWVYPEKKDIPQNASLVENGCYW